MFITLLQDISYTCIAATSNADSNRTKVVQENNLSFVLWISCGPF